MRKWCIRSAIAFGIILQVLYIGSYVFLSRRGYAEADRYNMKGFYYLAPENSDSWRFWNHACVRLFRPLNTVDRWLGLGRYPAYEPMWGFSCYPHLIWAECVSRRKECSACLC